MGASSQYTNLYNGDGYIYITGPSGTFPATAEEMLALVYPDYGYLNVVEVTELVRFWALRNVPENGAGYATFLITVTNAAADNCNSVLVGGVAQTAGAVAMTVGDTDASAASIAAGINSFVPGAGPNYRAVAVGSMIIGTSDATGSGTNGDPVAVAFSGASTADTVDVGGGRAIGDSLVRIWLDVSNSATDAALGPDAVEITDWVTHRGVESPRIKQDINVAASTLVFERMGNEMTIEAQLNGTVTNIISLGALDRDRITVAGNGVHTQTLTASATIGLNGSAVLTTALTSVTLEWDAGATKWNEISRSLVVDPTLLRANGVAIPLQDGVFQLAPAGGVALISPGQTGVSAFPGDVYEHDVLNIAGVVLGADLEYRIDTGSAINGDNGAVFGNGQAITVGANDVHFADNNGIQATLTSEMALSGLWAAYWKVTDAAGGTASWSVVPLFSTTNSQYLVTDMYEDLSVTGGKIANATIDGDVKLIDDSVTEVKLDTIVRAKLNALAWTAINVVGNHNATDRQSVYIDATAANRTVFLPAAPATIPQIIRVRKIDVGANTVTVDGQGNNIDGAGTAVLAAQYDNIEVEWDGNQWWINT